MALAVAVGLAASCSGTQPHDDEEEDGSDEGVAARGGRGGSGDGAGIGGMSGAGDETGGQGGTRTGGAGDSGAAAGDGPSDRGGASTTGGIGGEAGAGGDAGAAASATGGSGTGNGGTGAGNGGTSAGNSGSGGSSGTSGGSGGTAGNPTCGPDWAVTTDGYVTTQNDFGGCWRGYAFTGATAGSTITPENFATCGRPCMLCGRGSVAPAADYSGVAFLGFNLNQIAGSSTAGTSQHQPLRTALTVDWSNPLRRVVRLQLTGPDAATNPNSRWCYELPVLEGRMTIPYSHFNTKCWDRSGQSYANEPIQSILLVVPGSNEDPVTFNVCLNEIAEA